MPTILVVDDHEEIREALAEILEEKATRCSSPQTD